MIVLLLALTVRAGAAPRSAATSVHSGASSVDDDACFHDLADLAIAPRAASATSDAGPDEPELPSGSSRGQATEADTTLSASRDTDGRDTDGRDTDGRDTDGRDTDDETAALEAAARAAAAGDLDAEAAESTGLAGSPMFGFAGNGAFANAGEAFDAELQHPRPSRWGRINLALTWRRKLDDPTPDPARRDELWLVAIWSR